MTHYTQLSLCMTVGNSGRPGGLRAR